MAKQRRTKKIVPVIRRKSYRGTLAKGGGPRKETVPEGAEKRQTTMPKKQEAQEGQATLPRRGCTPTPARADSNRSNNSPRTGEQTCATAQDKRRKRIQTLIWTHGDT